MKTRALISVRWTARFVLCLSVFSGIARLAIAQINGPPFPAPAPVSFFHLTRGRDRLELQRQRLVNQRQSLSNARHRLSNQRYGYGNQWLRNEVLAFRRYARNLGKDVAQVRQHMDEIKRQQEGVLSFVNGRQSAGNRAKFVKSLNNLRQTPAVAAHLRKQVPHLGESEFETNSSPNQ